MIFVEIVSGYAQPKVLHQAPDSVADSAVEGKEPWYFALDS